MKGPPTVSALLQPFFTDRLVGQRNASPHTIASYRDTFRLLLQFAQRRLRTPPSALTLEDLDWCQDRIMPANPAYLIALPTKNDPMLSYLSTSFQDHVRLRHKFGYKVDDTMWYF